MSFTDHESSSGFKKWQFERRESRRTTLIGAWNLISCRGQIEIHVDPLNTGYLLVKDTC